MICKYCGNTGPNFYLQFHTEDCCYNCYADRHNNILFGCVLVLLLIGALWYIFCVDKTFTTKIEWKTIKEGEIQKVEYIPSVFDKRTAIHFKDGQVIFMSGHTEIPYKHIKIISPGGTKDNYYWEIRKTKRQMKSSNMSSHWFQAKLMENKG